MANPNHLQWLLEGVAAWNARRAADDFQPDFREANIRKAFADAGKLDEYRRMDLRGANLTEAILRGADLEGADVTSIIYSGAATNEARAPEYTDLSTATGLTQEQVDGMKGDSGTRLPPNITRPPPPDWPDLQEKSPQPKPERASAPMDNSQQEDAAPHRTTTASAALRQQVAFLLRVAPAAAATAMHTAGQIEIAVGEARLNSDEEPDLFLAVARSFRTLGEALQAADSKDAEIAALEATVAAQKAEIEQLTHLLAIQPSAKSQILVSALGGALAGAGATWLVSAPGFFFGGEATQIIQNLMQFFQNGGGLPPAPPPPSGPPTTMT